MGAVFSSLAAAEQRLTERNKRKKSRLHSRADGSLRYSLVTIVHPLVKLTKNVLLESFTDYFEDLKWLFQLVKSELFFEFLVKLFGLFFCSSCHLRVYLTEVACPSWAVDVYCVLYIVNVHSSVLFSFISSVLSFLFASAISPATKKPRQKPKNTNVAVIIISNF